VRAIHPDLVPYVRGYGSARDYLEAITVERSAAGLQLAHIRDTKAEWAEADGGAAAVDADFIRFDNGDLRLRGTLSTVIQSTTHPNLFTDLNKSAPYDVLRIVWAGTTEPSDWELQRLKLWLNPRVNAAQRREVARWRVALVNVAATEFKQIGTTGVIVHALRLLPLCLPVDMDVTGDTASEVTFDFTGLSKRPQPKRWGSPTVIPSGWPGSPYATSPVTLVFVYALNVDGAAASNVGMGYDAGVASVTTAGNVISGRHLIAAGYEFEFGPSALNDDSAAAGTPHCVIETGSYTAKTITFSSGNLFDLGAAPTGDVELVGLVQTPPGTSVTLEDRNDADSAYVAFTNGQFEEADLGLTSGQSRKMQATLTPNAAGNLTPTLRRLGRQAIARTDLSRVARLEGYEQAFDPETHKMEIPRPRLVAVKDGPRDFHSKIESLLADNFINDIRIRWWVGDPALTRDKWVHMDDFLVLDSSPRKPVIELQLVGLCALLKDLAPPYSPGTNYAPDGTQTIGSWTDLAGGTTNIHLGIDELVANETDGIRSGTSPANQQYIYTLPTPSDLAGRRLFVDCDYAKDAAGGEQIDLKIRVYQSAVLIAELTKTDIGPDRVQSTMELTEAQIAALTDPPNIRGAFVANAPAPGTGRRAHVYWARFRSGGRREVVTYANTTLKDVYDDLLTNRLSIPVNLIGPGVEDDTTTVSKQITGLRKRSPGSKDVIAKTELEAIACLADAAIGSSAGRITAFDLSDGQPINAVFVARRINIGETSPGHERRMPEYFVPYRWDAIAEEFKDEVRAFHTDSILKIGTVGLGPPKWLDEEIAKWIDTDALAETVGTRVVERLGTGEMLWGFTSSDRYPELEVGDVVAVETDQFVSRDPNLDVEIRGRRFVVGPLQRAGAGWNFTIHPRGYADIFASLEAASRILGLNIRTAEPNWRGDHLYVLWAGGPKVRSVKVATSTSAQPAAGTGTAVDGNAGEYDTGAATYTPRTYITVTPYSGLGATGVQGEAYLTSLRLPYIQTMFDAVTGKPLRSTAFNDQGAFLPFVSPNPGTFFSYASGGPAGAQMWISFDWSSSTLYRPDGTTLTVPAPPAAPSAPTLSQVAGGVLGARTRYAKIAYLKTDPTTGHETLYPVSAESSFAISANNLLKVTALADPGNGLYSGWAVLVGSASGSNYVQGTVAKQTFGVDWTEPAGGFSTTQNSLWTASWKKLTKIGIDPTTTYKHYPYYNISLDFVYVPAETTNASPQLASLQNGDGVLSLGRYGSAAGYSGVIDIATPAAASTGSGNVGGGRLT
jgi:hypothetical protein